VQYDLSLPDISAGFPGVVMDAMGWRFTGKGRVPGDVCLAYVRLEKGLYRTVKFTQGDLLNYIEFNHGDKYDQAIELFGSARQTLMNAVSVCNRWPYEQRDWPTLCWSMFAATASLFEHHDERIILMKRAVHEGWTVERMTDEVRDLQEAIHQAEHPDDPVLRTIKSTYVGNLELSGNRIILDVLEGALPPTGWNGLRARLTLTVEVPGESIQIGVLAEADTQTAAAL